MKQLELEKQKKESLLKERVESIASFRESLEIRITPFDLQMHNNYLELLKKRLKEQDKRIVLAEAFAEKKRLELIEAMRDRKMLDKLKEKALEEYNKEEQIREQKVLDEVVSYQYNDNE